jgi:hypothetical protein
MTDKEIRQMALEMFPIKKWFGSSDVNQIRREEAIQAMKAVRDKYEQKIQLIHLMNLE